MGLFSKSKKVGGKLVDVRVDKWVSWEYLTETTNRFKSILVDIGVPKKATFSETFEEALARLNLTEEDLARRKIEFTRLFFFFLGLAVIVILYGLFMAFKGGLISSLIAFCLSLYCLTQAFRFHFWLFQIKHRKLGCSWQEWFNSQVHTPESSSSELTVKETSQTPVKGVDKAK